MTSIKNTLALAAVRLNAAIREAQAAGLAVRVEVVIETDGDVVRPAVVTSWSDVSVDPERRELEQLRRTMREIELIVQGAAHEIGLAPEGEWGEIPADLHIADKLDKYVLQTLLEQRRTDLTRVDSGT